VSPPQIITPDIRQTLKEMLILAYGNAQATAPVWPSRVLGALDVGTTDTILVWPEPTIREFDRGPMGDDLIYQTLKWAQRRVTVNPYGVGLKLYNYDLRDLEKRGLPIVSMFGTQCGKKAGTFNARGTAYMLKNGTDATKVTARKGGALFRRGHPIGGDSTATHDNFFEGVTFNMNNLAAIRAYARGIDDGSGEPESPEAEAFVIVPENFQLRAVQLTNAEMLADQISGIANASSNTYYKGQFGYQEPIVTSFLDVPTDWYVVIPGWSEGNEAPLNRMELEGWTLTEFASANQLSLAQSESMESHHKARVGFAGGNPKRIIKCTSTGNINDNDARFLDIIANL
jgi:hypothetical protein